MKLNELTVKNENDISKHIKDFRLSFGRKPDYLVLSSKTLQSIYGVGIGSVPKHIEYLRYLIDEDIKEGFIKLAEA